MKQKPYILGLQLQKFQRQSRNFSTIRSNKQALFLDVLMNFAFDVLLHFLKSAFSC